VVLVYGGFAIDLDEELFDIVVLSPVNWLTPLNVGSAELDEDMLLDGVELLVFASGGVESTGLIEVLDEDDAVVCKVLFGSVELLAFTDGSAELGEVLEVLDEDEAVLCKVLFGGTELLVPIEGGAEFM
jgi:hypothetical protein